MAFAKSKRGRLYTRGKALSEEFRLIIISKLVDGGANEETGSIPRGVKRKVALELLIDKNSVSRAWESWITNRDVAPKPKNSKGSQGKLDQNDLQYIEFLKRERPSSLCRKYRSNQKSLATKTFTSRQYVEP